MMVLLQHCVLCTCSHSKVKCLNPGDGCPDGTYQVTNGAPIVPYQSLLSGGNRSVCYACDPLCTLCSGPSTTDCSACSHATIPSQTGGRECADSCINNNNCYYCDEECVGCRGESPTDCVSCKNSMMVWNGRELCVPSCSNDTYLHILPSGKSECIPCDGECNRCTGSSNADCIACLHYTQMTGSGMMCFASCPDGTYTNVTSHCLPCHQDCKRCSGPGNTECYVCQGEDDSVNRTLHVNCGKQCPVGYTYDIEGGDCDLIM